MRTSMRKIIHIFDGDFGCEENFSKKPTVSVTLEDENGNKSFVTVEDKWLVDHNLDIGDFWIED